MSEEQANIKVMRGKMAELHEAYEKLVAAYVANPPPHWLLPRDPADEPVPQCCANCEQGETITDQVGGDQRIRVKCAPSLTTWMREQFETFELEKWDYMKPTDGAECDCFIPRGGDNAGKEV